MILKVFLARIVESLGNKFKDKQPYSLKIKVI